MVFNGRRLADKILTSLAVKIKKLPKKPSLLILVAKEDKKGRLYTKLIKKQAQKVGIKTAIKLFSLYNLDCSLITGCSYEKAPRMVFRRFSRELLRGENEKKYSAILIQKPGQSLRQKHFKSDKKFEIWWLTNTSRIPEKKDVDCLNVANLGLLTAGLIQFYPATVKAIWRIFLYALETLGVKISKTPDVTKKKRTFLGVSQGASFLNGKKVTILGASEIVGKPLSMLLRNHGAHVTLVGESGNIKPYTTISDIIISCVGKPKIITANMIKKSAIIIDAGLTLTHRECNTQDTLGNFTKKPLKAVGDVDFNAVKNKASFITPVPGGVGPVTIACLLENCYLASKRQAV